MTIEVRTGAPATAGNDDRPPPVRRPAPPRYVPCPAAKAPPQASSAPPAPARARMRATQAARQGEPRREPCANAQADAGPRAAGCDVQAPAPERPHGNDDDAGAGAGAAGATGVGGAAGAPSEDGGVQAALLGLHEQQGIFELLLPGGQSLGVVVQATAGGVHFLLSAGGGALEQHLRQNKMELERRLQQRMRKDVRIAVL
ncbi:hypothetical protein IV454_18920 [Massilia antarctica]|uniref:Flagellar hook-length control protein FliK n=1 Tax=Massilia antarctica TaxID=2765360 RepID=A0AA49A5M8_9BURK|nr:hypothetical protein [Massilia antarctica]QPI47658.1 hypothetical protein IV454_18920 [Massilia antarctica]